MTMRGQAFEIKNERAGQLFRKFIWSRSPLRQGRSIQQNSACFPLAYRHRKIEAASVIVLLPAPALRPSILFKPK
jgi:hypothetical protein